MKNKQQINPHKQQKGSSMLYQSILFSLGFILLLVTTSSAQEFSYEQYSISNSDVQPKLHGLVKKLNSYSSSSQLSRFINTAESTKSRLSRGYHDEISFLQGAAYQKAGKTALAKKKFQEAISKGFKKPIAKWKLAKIELALGEYPKALALLQELAWLSENAKHEVYMEIAELYQLQKKEEKQEQFINKALVESPGYTRALGASIALKRNKLATIREPKERAALQASISSELIRLQQSDPNNREASVALARKLMSAEDPLLSSGKLNQAESILRGILDSSSFEDIEAVRLLSELQLKRNELTAASETLARGLKLNPENPELLKMVKQVEILQKSSIAESPEE